MVYNILVSDIHCIRCVERIEKALNEAGIKFTVSLDDKTVTVDGCEHCLKTAVSELEDLGFTPEVK